MQATARVLKVHPDTVAQWNRKAAEHCRKVEEATLKRYGHMVKFPRAGKRGRPRKPVLVPDDRLRYGQVIKHRRNGRLVEVEREQVLGEDDGMSISTSGVDRCNLTSRRENSRLARRTLGFSKSREALRAHLALFFAHYNLCRPHGSLVHRDDSGARRKWTPMRELRITDHNRSLEELLTSPYHKMSA